MYFRDQKQIFKPNDNFTQKRGFLYCQLYDNVINIKVINILPQQNDDGLSLHDMYNKYSTLIQNDKGIAIMQYFEIDQNGEDVEQHISVVQCELRTIKTKALIRQGIKNND